MSLENKINQVDQEIRDLNWTCKRIEKDIRLIQSRIDLLEKNRNETLNAFIEINDTITVLDQEITQMSDYLFETIDIKGLVKKIKGE